MKYINSKEFYNREIARCQITVTSHKMYINVSYRRQNIRIKIMWK